MKRVGCIKWDGSALGFIAHDAQKWVLVSISSTVQRFYMFHFENLSFSKSLLDDCLILLLQSRYSDDNIVQQIVS